MIMIPCTEAHAPLGGLNGARFELCLRALDGVEVSALIVRARDGVVLAANAAATRMYAEDVAPLTGLSVDELNPIGWRGPSSVRDHLASCVASGALPSGGLISRVRTSGAREWHRVRAERLADDPRGELWLVTDRDVTERHNALLAQRAAEQTFRKINDAIADVVFSVDMPARRIAYVNRAIRSLFGYEPHEVLNQTTRIFYRSDEDYQAFGARLIAALERGERRVLSEQQLVRASGEVFWASISTTFFFEFEDERLTQVISVVRDISEHKVLEQELLHAQKLDAIGTLAGGIAHDVNNVLSIVLGLSTVLENELAANTQHWTDIKRISTAARRGKSVVENLLAFSRKRELHRESLSVSAAINRIVKMLSYTLEKRISFETDVAPALPPIEGDPNQLEVLLMNLCLNAADAIEGRGSIRVGARVTSASSRDRDARPAYVQIEVADDGMGMTEAVRRRAFEPFFTTKPLGKGTGLGLSTVYGVVQKAGGSVDIESVPGEGTAVIVRLPVANASASATRADDGHGRVPATVERARDVQLLVIDDELLVREMLERTLEVLGYQVTSAGDATSAIEVFRKHHHEIELVILDCLMPGIDGSDCFDRLRMIDPAVRVLVCTGHFDSARTRKMLERGALGVLYKPFELDKLSTMLAELVPKPEVP